MQKLALTLSVICVALAAFNSWASHDIVSKRRLLEEKQAAVKEAAQLRQINDQLIRALANAAASTNDVAIREMLASEGVTFKVNAPVSDAAPGSSGADGDGDVDSDTEDGQ